MFHYTTRWQYTNTQTYSVTDTGPAGGIVFYINDPANVDTMDWKYLEPSPAGNQKTDATWGLMNAFDTFPANDAYGMGEANTLLILSWLSNEGTSSHRATPITTARPNIATSLKCTTTA